MPEFVHALASEAYILNRSTGEPDLAELRHALIQIETIHRQTGICAVLVDAREKRGTPSAEHALEGALALTKLTSQGIRFAILALSPPDRRLDFFENVVTNYGGRLRFFTDKVQAIAWLQHHQHV